MLKRIKSFFKAKPKPNSLAHCYTDKDRNKYYVLLNQSDMSADRVIKLLEFNRHVELCLTKERLDYIKEQAIKALNDKKLNDVALWLNEFAISNELFAEIKTLENLATIFFYLEDEPIDRYEEHWQNLKKENWRKDKESRFFFVEQAWRTTGKYSKDSKFNLRKYLEENILIDSEQHEN